MRYLRRIGIWLFSWVVLTGAYAEVYTVETVPSPKGQGQNYYVTNPDGVLLTETEAELNRMLTGLEQKTEVEVAVVAIDAYDEQRYTAYTFSLDLFNHWGIGKADKNTGVLVFLARQSRDIQIITGKGIDGILTDARCGEILDYNMDYLAEDEFDEGLLHICGDISDYLMEDENRAELLLGWQPESLDGSFFMGFYFFLGFVLMVILAFVAYKKLNGEPGQTKKELQKKADEMNGCAGCSLLVFPIPMFFFYIYYYVACKLLKDVPLTCKKCGGKMVHLSDEEMLSHLTKAQQVEQSLSANEYIAWECPACGEVALRSKPGCFHARYDECPQCKGRTLKLTDSKTTIRPTYDHGGEKINYYTCECCQHKMSKKVSLAHLVRSYSSSGSSSGSWGGWSSSGGSSGSWGGGSSYGGGAGRRF